MRYRGWWESRWARELKEAEGGSLKQWKELELDVPGG